MSLENAIVNLTKALEANTAAMMNKAGAKAEEIHTPEDHPTPKVDPQETQNTDKIVTEEGAPSVDDVRSLCEAVVKKDKMSRQDIKKLVYKISGKKQLSKLTGEELTQLVAELG